MTGMDDLVTFLRATWDQDEREAHEQKRFDAWVQEQRGDHVDAIVIPPLSQLGSAGDPDRVLAEVDAKRRILDQYQAARDQARNPVSAKNYEMARNEQGALGDVLRLLALPHADRPGYDESWRP